MNNIEYSYEIIETKRFKINFEPAVFGWFIFFKSARNITAEHGHWLLHSLFYVIRFFLLLMPAIVLDIATSGGLFILSWIFDISKYSAKKIIDGTKDISVNLFKTVFKIIMKISIAIILIIIAISLYTNIELWHKVLLKLSDTLSLFL